MSLHPETFIDKLGKLSTTQQSIETLSQWCIFYKKDAEAIVSLWEKDFNRSRDVERMLALLYLANDILQNSRKKGPQFVNQFYAKLPLAMHKLVKAGGVEVKRKMAKMVKVWEDRHVFGSSGVKPFTDVLGQPAPAIAQRPSAGPTSAGRKRGNIVLQTSDPNVNSLSTSMQDADDAHDRCQALRAQTPSFLKPDEGLGDADSLKVSIKSRQLLITALENEIGHRDRVIGILSNLLSQQKSAKDAAESQWQTDRAVLEDLQQRQRLAHEAAAPQHDEQNGDLEEPVIIQQTSQSPPPPPMEALESPPNRNDPRLSQSGPRLSQPAGEAADPQSPIALSSDPEVHLADPTALTQLLGSVDGGSGHQAADLVAQLATGGMSAEMLMEALQTLPKGSNGDSGLQNDGLAPMNDDEEEYDPELGE